MSRTVPHPRCEQDEVRQKCNRLDIWVCGSRLRLVLQWPHVSGPRRGQRCGGASLTPLARGLLLKRILICSPKGGCGKSTLARQLAVAAQTDRLSIATADLDPQKALTRWYLRRPEEKRRFPHYEVGWDDVGELIEPDGIDDADLLIVDTPPSVEAHPEAMKRLARASDLVLVPSKVTYDDVDSVIPYVTALRGAGIRLSVVLNATKPNVNTSFEKEAILRTGAEVCPVEIADRTDYWRLSGRGLAILDLSRHPAIGEVRALWAFVRGRLGMAEGTQLADTSGSKVGKGVQARSARDTNTEERTDVAG